MLEEGRISPRQFFAFIFATITAVSTFELPHLLLQAAKHDFWLALLLAVALDLTIGGLLFFLGRRYPGRDLFAYAEEILGRVGGKIAGVIYSLFFLEVCVLETRSFGEFLLVMMPETPLVVFVGILVLLAAYATYLGLEVIGRAGELVLLLLLLVTIGIPLLASPKMDLGYLLPLYQTPFRDVLRAGLTVTAFYGVCLMMGVLMAYLNLPQHALKTKAAAVSLAGLLMAAGYAAALGLFGPQVIFPGLRYISYQVTRLISIRGFFERLDALAMILWFAGAFIAVSVLFYCGALGLARVASLKSYRPLVILLGVAVAALAVYQFPDSTALESFIKSIFVPGALAVEVGLTGLLALVAAVRPKKP
ncbi:MAG: hypothetical protein D9V47_14420 [Clostridia bacterium]|nr:MAG: hypothetical protein D9V47_14420 [Clostridia bacterium]